jgi:hypothetical protein
MIFPMFAFVVVFTSVVFSLLGVTEPGGSIWGILFSSDSLRDIFKGILVALWDSADIYGSLFGVFSTIAAGGAAYLGFIYNRDEPLYGGLGVLLFKMLGLYSILTLSKAPVGFGALIIAFVGLFNLLFVISFINWIRGKGE